jgi:thioredoxin 1
MLMLLVLAAAAVFFFTRILRRPRMKEQKTPEQENSQSKSLFKNTAAEEPANSEGASCSCRVWSKFAIVAVLAVAVAAVFFAKGRRGEGTSPQSSPPGGRKANTTGGNATADLPPETVLATVNGKEITLAELENALREMPEQSRDAFKNSRHELLEQIILRELLLQKARATNIAETQEYRDAASAHKAHPGHEEHALIDALLQREVLQKITVTDEDIRRTYEELKDDLPDQSSFEEVKDDLRAYVRQEKQNKAIEAYLAKLREAATITQNEEWVAAEKARAADNPLDKALTTGRPVVADFGRGICIPCKMMKPILDELKELYRGHAEILIIDIDEYPAVTRRVGIRVIPTQVFYDSQGKEVYRHQGFMSKEDIVKQLEKMGVK